MRISNGLCDWVARVVFLSEQHEVLRIVSIWCLEVLLLVHIGGVEVLRIVLISIPEVLLLVLIKRHLLIEDD